jgi:hypothetical protein
MASQEERDRIMAEYMQAQQGDDDDDEEEAEFEPGNDDDSDADDDDAFQAEDDDDEEDYIMLKGSFARHDGCLLYKGRVLSETFELKSIEPKVYWEVRQPTKTSADESTPPRTRRIEMEGSMGKDTVKVELILTVQENGNSHVAVGKSSGEDDEEEDSKMAAKPSAAKSANVYTVYGKGTASAENFEFLGQLDPSTAKHNSIPLECRKRMVSAAPAGAAAVATAVVDEDDEDDADEELDYDELIALHEDAGMSVEALRKRYAGGGAAGDNDDDAKPEAKKQKTQEESEDDEYGF